MVLSAADSVGNVYRPLIQLSVLIDCQAAASLLAFSLVFSAYMLHIRPRSLFSILFLFFTIHLLLSVLSSDFLSPFFPPPRFHASLKMYLCHSLSSLPALLLVSSCILWLDDILY